MKRFVETYNLIEGFHNWPDARNDVEYLSARHRHLFEIRTRIAVSHNEREVEINTMQAKIASFLSFYFGKPCEFENRSCETIAELILKRFNCESVTVLEDGYGGASLTR